MSAAAFFFGSTPSGRTALAFCPTSRTVKAPFTGTVLVRIMGAGGPGAASASTATSAGNGGTVAFVEVAVTQGDDIVATLGAAGVGVVGSLGTSSGTTTVTGPNGLNASVPGGTRGAVGAAPAANTVPTGVDQYWPGGLGGYSTNNNGDGGGSPALLEGTAAGYQGGQGDGGNFGGGGAGPGGNGGNAQVSAYTGKGAGAGGPAVGATPGPDLLGSTTSTTYPVVTETHSRLLVNISARGELGLSGSGANGGASTAGGNGGFGGGGGGGGAGSGGNGGRGAGGGGAAIGGSYKGGDAGGAFVVLEFKEG